ncbi:MAG: Crp/Fnr family transcriptional regulator [Saprospiraceae bacterium]|jgi:CRP/FNR family transcriptional regulator|nr:Crp/Fnr family transcriptional regulator [Saprospiraceae bacterium]MBK6664696.1 Crp/Fnr family transcriptional regulator [Saprospiraceae bacterium]MBK7698754.1 Crp/Fnr family transcriptional regulator [Saprospiraceae bacterium]MBK8826383.1 Crp/Fnr family transcriptional regulator [Saprospiraceae bacterium]MBK8885089.1 Crp/Fnr family transcriptional regulator [Saprospiraceae bacterium]
MLMDKFQYIFESELINELCKSGVVKTYKEGSTLMDIGQVLTHMPLVISGSVKVLKEDKEGNELLLYYLEYGDTCAVTMSCCTKPSKSAIKAITESDAEILFIPIEKMEEWMVKYKSWRGFVLDSYNIRMNEMLDAIDNLAFNNMEERLYKYLREKVMITKESKIHITHFQIANELNSSRVVISRLMKKLENEGLVIQHRNYVEVKEFM